MKIRVVNKNKVGAVGNDYSEGVVKSNYVIQVKAGKFGKAVKDELSNITSASSTGVGGKSSGKSNNAKSVKLLDLIKKSLSK